MKTALWRLFPAALAAAWCAASALWGNLLPPCGFRWLTGLACPLCGMTGALRALAAGQPGEALRLNLLSPAVALLLLFAALGVRWTPGMRRYAPGALAAAFGLYGALRAARLLP